MSDAGGIVHANHYQRWDGRLRSARWVWLAIAANGVKLRLKDPRIMVLVLSSAAFVVIAWLIFYVLSLAEALVGTPEAQTRHLLVRAVLSVDISDAGSIAGLRLPLWQSVFILLTRLELLYLIVVVGWLGPGLIADDLRSNALPIYFARPITPFTYLLGKWLSIVAFIAVGCLIPNLLALAGGLLIAGGLATWGQTLGLVFDLMVSGFGVMLVGGLLILALSSLTPDKRFVIVAWLAILLLPEVARWILDAQLADGEPAGILSSLSLGNNIVVLTTWLFDLRGSWAATSLNPGAYAAALGRPIAPLYPALVMLSVTSLAAIVTYYRVLRFSKAAANL
jgi:hypothetical protein